MLDLDQMPNTNRTKFPHKTILISEIKSSTHFSFLRERESMSACRGRARGRIFFFFFNVYLFLRETECKQEEGQREGDIELKVGFGLSAQSPMWGLKLTNHEIMT